MAVSRSDAPPAPLILEPGSTLLAGLYRSAPVGICVLDRDLRFLSANDRYLALVGRSSDEVVGRTIPEVVHPSAREDSCAMVARVIATGRPVDDRELRQVMPGDPSRNRSWLVSLHPLELPGHGRTALAVVQDITSVRRAEQEARERLEELESVYRNAPVGLSFVDRDLRYLRVNRIIADINGVSIEEMVGRTYRDFDPAGADLAEPFLRALMERGEPVRNLEVRNRPPTDPENEHVYLLNMDPVRGANGEILGHTSSVQDVTELRRLEASAARRLEELETLYARAPVGLCYVDAELRIVHLNPLFAQLGELPLDRQVGATPAEVLPAHLARQLVPALRNVAATGQSSGELEVRGRPPGGGRDYTWCARIHPVTSRGHEVTGIILVLQDVTVLADRQRAVEAVRDRLAEAQRVARVGSYEWDLVGDEVWWSPELYQIFGEDETYVPTYISFFDHVHPDDRPKVRRQLEQTLADGEPYRVTFRVQRPDGEPRVLFTAARLERTTEGLPLRLVGTCQDVTDLDPRA